MNEQPISDNRLKVFWQKWLHKNPNKLPNLKFCGHRVIKQHGTQTGVLILKNDADNETKFFGATACNSTWACPTCTARVMSKRANDISCAIDALKKKHGQTAVMITFTLPHFKNMSCKDIFTIFLQTWRLFVRSGNHSSRSFTYTVKTDSKVDNYKAGDKRTYKKGNDAYGKFREELEIKHVIKAYEFTWGENSWHPHIHALFFIPNQNFKKVLDYEESLKNRWYHVGKKVATDYYVKSYGLGHRAEALEFIESLYPEWKKDYHSGVTISKNADGSARKVSSSWYISGWGADHELTGEKHKQKQALEGHMTPHQIIQHAYEVKNTNPEESEQYLKLYREYAETTFGHKRVDMSAHSGLTKIIREWKQTTDYKETYLKKNLHKENRWKVVYWFTESQWSRICYLESQIDDYIKPQILELARAPNGKELIIEFLEKYSIEENKLEYCHKEHIENIFNHQNAA